MTVRAGTVGVGDERAMMSFRDRFDRSKRRPSTRTQRIGFAFFWLVLLSYAYIIPSNPSFNSESHLYLTFSLVDHHSVTIDRYNTRLGDESYWRGHFYSDKAPGLSLLAVPPYAALRALFPHKMGQGYEAHRHMQYAIKRDTAYIRYAISYALVMLPSAIFAVLLWLFLCQFTRGQAWPLLVAAAYALGTIAWYYSTVFFSHQITAMMLFGAFMITFRWVRGRLPDRSSYLAAGGAGFLVAYAAISEYPTAVLGAALAVYLLVVARRRLRSLAAFAAGAVSPVAAGMWYNVAAFGKPFATGYMHVHSMMYRNEVKGGAFGFADPSAYGVQMPHLSALWQITFGTYRGIFLVSPVLLLFFAGASFMWRRRDLRAEWFLCVGVVVLYFLLDSGRGVDTNGWSGGWSVASRHLTPVLPFMIVPLVFALQSRLFRSALVALSIVSIAFMFMIVTSQGDFSSTDQNPLVNEMLAHFARGHILVNWGYMTGFTGFPSMAPYVLMAFLLIVRLIWLFRRPAVSFYKQPAGIPLSDPA